ncbi:Eukaryotic peptide chain release factor GTP-binding subunit ERF3A [Nosema granulosis]|uniref:Eukaryotic peptide chain release factor GTP-binding subunit ERF3A n=1 Tax=Nosema granulosis TaxID=83296 RepID=A0A9P6KZV4_9MICR|nr:Eukaryotic peptide chain release factor GTP-binding subunit ERF3A [Nosema granulosis]
MDLDKLRISNKEIVNIVFVGHVDAGKSTICGQILVLQGLVDKRTIEKYKEASKESGRESWYLSWCLDTNPEEREKGKTTEVGTASFELPNRRINVLDAPGHKQYVFEMISGANAADVGVLVVSARINEFEAGFEKGGQTREHILLMKSSSVQKIIVLVNKMDDPSVNWSLERFTEIKRKIGAYVKNLFPTPEFIPISGMSGENIKYKKEKTWYEGPTFFDLLDRIELKKKDLSVLDITITEKSKLMGASFVCGMVNSGRLTKESTVKVIPGNQNLSIANLYDLDDVEVPEGVPGDTLKIKFKNSDLEELEVGHRLVEPSSEVLKACTRFTCGINILDSNGLICLGYSCMLHIGIVSVQCKIKELRNKDNKKIRFVRTGDKALALIEVDNTIVLSPNKDRFSLRIADKTLAVGVVRNIKE